MGRVLHASGSGYFPFCLYTGTTGIGQGTMRPFGITIENCMEMFWRVRRWRAEFECGGINLIHEFLNLGGEPGRGSGGGGYPAPESEEQIVCANGSSPFPIPATFAQIEEFDDSFYRSLQLGLFLGGATESDPLQPNTGTINDRKNMVYFNKNNNLYYPIFSCQISISDQATFLATIGTYPFFSPTFSLIPIRFLSGIDEEIAVVPTYFSEVGLPSGFSKADIKAIEYWSYGGLYDTTTGELL